MNRFIKLVAITSLSLMALTSCRASHETDTIGRRIQNEVEKIVLAIRQRQIDKQEQAEPSPAEPESQINQNSDRVTIVGQPRWIESYREYLATVQDAQGVYEIYVNCESNLARSQSLDDQSRLQRDQEINTNLIQDVCRSGGSTASSPQLTPPSQQYETPSQQYETPSQQYETPTQFSPTYYRQQILGCNGKQIGANFREYPSFDPSSVLGVVAPGDAVNLTGRTVRSGGELWYEAVAPQLFPSPDLGAQNRIEPNQVGWISSCFVNR